MICSCTIAQLPCLCVYAYVHACVCVCARSSCMCGQLSFVLQFPDEEDMGCDVSLLGIGTEFIHWIDGGSMEVCVYYLVCSCDIM